MKNIGYSKRQFLKYSLVAGGVVSLPWLASCKGSYKVAGLSSVPDSNGLLLPPNCSSRVIARAGNIVENSTYVWHAAPDGGGVIADKNSGWLYISNRELKNNKGGVSVIKFDAEGNIRNAYAILNGSNRNCGGCLTPWNTWLSCEEISKGVTWECDPFGNTNAEVRENLGVFKHESVAIDPDSLLLYLTEDEKDSCFYRFSPSSIEGGKANLSNGVLEVAVVDDSKRVTWKKIEDPLAKSTATRYQVNGVSTFNGGEGIVYNNGAIYFDTKGDNRIWKFDIKTEMITIFYDASTIADPVLTGVDTIAVFNETLLVCEDGGDNQIVAVSPDKKIKPILQLVGHDNSEITGLAISPDKSRLYFNSQRGATGSSQDAVTYEVTGPFI